MEKENMQGELIKTYSISSHINTMNDLQNFKVYLDHYFMSYIGQVNQNYFDKHNNFEEILETYDFDLSKYDDYVFEVNITPHFNYSKTRKLEKEKCNRETTIKAKNIKLFNELLMDKDLKEPLNYLVDNDAFWEVNIDYLNSLDEYENQDNRIVYNENNKDRFIRGLIERGFTAKQIKKFINLMYHGMVAGKNDNSSEEIKINKVLFQYQKVLDDIVFIQRVIGKFPINCTKFNHVKTDDNKIKIVDLTIPVNVFKNDDGELECKGLYDSNKISEIYERHHKGYVPYYCSCTPCYSNESITEGQIEVKIYFK